MDHSIRRSFRRSSALSPCFTSRPRRLSPHAFNAGNMNFTGSSLTASSAFGDSFRLWKTAVGWLLGLWDSGLYFSSLGIVRRTEGLKDRRTEGPKDRRTEGPKDRRTEDRRKGPKDQMHLTDTLFTPFSHMACGRHTAEGLLKKIFVFEKVCVSGG